MVFGPVLLCSVCADYADDSSASSCDCLAQGCRCGGFFPNSAVFALVLGICVLGYGILALALLFLGCAYGVAFLAPSTFPTLRPSPAVAGFVVFAAALLSVAFLERWSCVFFLSSCSAWGRLLLSLFLVLLLCLFMRQMRFSLECPAAGYTSGVTQPFWLLLPVLLLRWS